jgi:DNA-binding transcriptional LysR family regulator
VSARQLELDLRLVRYAVAVAEELHFGRAAARLFISEQTLSFQIKQFESRLGLTLFQRDRRHVELTAAGALLMVRGRQLLAAADDLVREMSGHSAPLRIDMISEGLGTPDRIVERLGACPGGIPLEIRQGHGLSHSITRLASGELDLAIGRAWSAQLLSTAFQTMLVRLDPIGVMLPPDHVLAGRPTVRMAELADVPLLIFSPFEATEWQNWQEELTHEFALRSDRLVHGQGLSAARSALRAHGQAQLCPLDVQPSADIAVRPLVDPVPIYPWSVIWREARQDQRLELALALIADLAHTSQWLTPPAGDWWMPESDVRAGSGRLGGLAVAIPRRSA